jgi:acyl-CoA synthetase (AMP-forming)/AMP-acid ligase II
MTVLLNVGEVLSAQARLQPDVVGARDLDRSLTFSVWNARACRLANALLGLGLSRGERVAVLAYNRVEWAEIYIAVAKAGLMAVPINFRLTSAEAAYIIADSGAAAVLVEHALDGLVDEIRDRLDLPEQCYLQFGAPVPPGYEAYEGLIALAADREPAVAALPDDPWCLMYTSGTTGHP